ncbi:hypothetical protein HYW75_05875 [Candidatus Pacearchaeota archaeon]|nr:hypothetical protein [Candidatus Pacearchaeota archaeon]
MTSTAISSLIALSVIGLIDAAYISWHSLRKKPLVCPINKHDCNAVVQSSYGKFFGIKNEFLGIFYYLFVIIFAMIFFFNNIVWIKYLLIISSLLALAASAYLFYVQKYILKNYCFYCIISAIINLLLFLNILAV